MPRRSGKRVYEQDYAGVGQLLRSPGVDADLRARAERVLATARATAPVVTQAYRDSLQLEREETDRVRYNIISTVAYANTVEFLHRTLGRAIDAAGGG